MRDREKGHDSLELDFPERIYLDPGLWVWHHGRASRGGAFPCWCSERRFVIFDIYVGLVDAACWALFRGATSAGR